MKNPSLYPVLEPLGHWMSFAYASPYPTEYFITTSNKALWTDLADQEMEMQR